MIYTCILLPVEFAYIVSELEDLLEEPVSVRGNDEAASILLANCNICRCFTSQLHTSKLLSIPLNIAGISSFCVGWLSLSIYKNINKLLNIFKNLNK